MLYGVVDSDRYVMRETIGSTAELHPFFVGNCHKLIQVQSLKHASPFSPGAASAAANADLVEQNRALQVW